MLKPNGRLSEYEQWLEGLAQTSFGLWGRHKVGVLGTIAVNLLVVVTLLAFELSGTPHPPESLMLVDFEREYEIVAPAEPEIEEPPLPADALNPELEWEAIRNIAVDATKEDLNPGLYDEKSIDADELYQEAQRIRDEMQKNRELWEDSQDEEEVNIPNVETKHHAPDDIGHFKGPTVISYFLENRKAFRLPVPSYKCEGGGQVVVDIEVGADGRVRKATIDTANSVIDECMNQAALVAARSSIFSASPRAPAKQTGSITYLFVRQ